MFEKKKNLIFKFYLISISKQRNEMVKIRPEKLAFFETWKNWKDFLAKGLIFRLNWMHLSHQSQKPLYHHPIAR